ncbi:MAG: hypothetical protein ACLGXA_09175 [Acidobacteriota bacterium]
MRRASMQATTMLAAVGALALAGCATNATMSVNPQPKPAPAATAVQGEAFGGQQPVVGMSLQLYAAGTSGYGSAATAVFGTPLTTNSNGGFTFPTGWASGCPTTTSPVYLVGTGGDPVAGNTSNGGSTAANPQLALAVALGPCNSLNSSTHIHMNELTTVAAAWALAPFMSGNTTSYLNVGTSSTNTAGLAMAFAAAAQLVNTSTGTVGGSTLPAGATVPTAEIYSIGNILEACINSKGGVANDGTACGTLFGDTPSSTGYPTDTITAAMNIAQNPGRNVAALFNIATGTPAFMTPLTSAPNAWTIAIQYTGGGLNAPTAIAADQSGNIWVANSASTGTGAVSLFDNLGNSKLGTTGATIGGTPGGLAIDLNGNGWVTSSNNEVYELTSSGTTTTTLTGNGLNLPTAIAIDPSSNIWLVNSASGANTVSAFTSAGGTVSGSPFSGAGIAAPAGIAINGNANANCADCH